MSRYQEIIPSVLELLEKEVTLLKDGKPSKISKHSVGKLKSGLEYIFKIVYEKSENEEDDKYIRIMLDEINLSDFMHIEGIDKVYHITIEHDGISDEVMSALIPQLHGERSTLDKITIMDVLDYEGWSTSLDRLIEMDDKLQNTIIKIISDINYIRNKEYEEKMYKQSANYLLDILSNIINEEE